METSVKWLNNKSRLQTALQAADKIPTLQIQVTQVLNSKSVLKSNIPRPNARDGNKCRRTENRHFTLNGSPSSYETYSSPDLNSANSKLHIHTAMRSEIKNSRPEANDNQVKSSAREMKPLVPEMELDPRSWSWRSDVRESNNICNPRTSVEMQCSGRHSVSKHLRSISASFVMQDISVHCPRSCRISVSNLYGVSL